MAKEIESSTAKNSQRNVFHVTDFGDASDYATHFVSPVTDAVPMNVPFEGAWEAYGITVFYLSDATRCGTSFLRPRTTIGERYNIETQPVSRLIAKIRAALSLNITELASVLNVERPTIYAWQGQKAVPTAHNLRRLQAIARFADQWNEKGLSALGALVRTAATDGTSLVDLLSTRVINEMEITSRLQELAVLVRRAKQTSDVDSYFEKKGLDPARFKAKTDGIDRLTGKRTSLESED